MKYQHFSIEERETIQKLWWDRLSVRSIAAVLGRSPSSVSRELKRNFPKEHQVYTPRLAQLRAMKNRKSRGRTERLKNLKIRSFVTNHLKIGWSPEQISGRMKLEGLGQISHEAIYQYVYAQVHRDGFGYLKPGHEDLRIYLRRKKKRRTKKGQRTCQRLYKPMITSIDFRPKVVAQKKRFGDFESDTVESCGHKPGVNTLLERKSGIYFVSKVADKTSKATVAAITKRLSKIPAHLKQTITLDNGSENSDWQNLQEKTRTRIFYAHPYHSWERGANENTNGLLREYFPKKTDFTMITEQEIAKVEAILNSRPRKRLGYLTPLEVWSVALEG